MNGKQLSNVYYSYGNDAVEERSREMIPGGGNVQQSQLKYKQLTYGNNS